MTNDVNFDNTQAQAEGWFISFCDGYMDEKGEPRPWQLQREDEREVFASDLEAWAHVVSKARAGSEYHRDALDFLAKHSPAEHAAIVVAMEETTGYREADYAAAEFQPFSTSLALRKTHQFVGTWQHEDQWDHMGSVVVQQKISQITDDEDCCDPTITNMICEVTLAFGVDRENVRQALRDTFTKQGCSHDWDCCGCVSTSVRRVKHIHGNTFVVSTYSSRNY
jgi:hypothetical protein